MEAYLSVLPDFHRDGIYELEDHLHRHVEVQKDYIK